MKRIFGSFFLMGGVFLFGVSQVYAAEPLSEYPQALLVEQKTQERTQTTRIILIGDLNLLTPYVTQYLLDPISMEVITNNLEFGRIEGFGGLEISPVASATAPPLILVAPTTSSVSVPVLAPVQVAAPTSVAASTPTTQTSTPTPVVTSPTVIPLASAPKTLQLTELYPNTTGDDKTEEYVRVQNTGSQPIDLKGWALKDASGKTYAIAEPMMLLPNATFKITRAKSNITLNNDQDEIFLVAPDGEVIDRVAYLEAPEGDVLKKTADGWKWPVHPSSTPSTTPLPTIVTMPPVTSPAPAPVVVTAPQTVTPQPVAALVVPPSPKTLVIVELYPNTTNSDETEEYVRLKNTGELPVHLTGWMLKDSSDKTYTLTQTEPLASGNTVDLMRPQTKLTLNNEADQITLIAPDGQSVDTLSYASAPQGETYQKIDDHWYWSSQIPTTQSTMVSTGAPPTAQPTSSTAHTNLVVTSTGTTIAKIKLLPDASVVDVTGTVTVLPGRLGKQFFYVQENGSAVQVYKNDASFPEMTVGTRVRMVGVMSTSGTERRLKIDKTGSIEPLESGTEPTAEQQNIIELNAENIGKLVRVAGMLVTVSSDRMTIEQDGKSLEIAIASGTNIDASVFKPGDHLEATGIVRPFGEKIKLMPREQTDLVVKNKLSAVTTATIGTGNETKTHNDQKLAGLLAAASGTILMILVIKHFLRKQQTSYVHNSVSAAAETVR